MLLHAQSVTFSYPRSTNAVLGEIALSLAAGEVVALIGPNGSGKSTLLRCLLGQLPSTGTVQWDGRAVSTWRRRELARYVAYLPQAPAHEPGQTVAEVLRLGRAPYWGAFGLETAADMAAVREVAGVLALDDLLGRPLDELSGGQRQRVFVGRCLAQGPKALLLDEPNTFLDLRHQVELCQLLRKLADEKQIGILMASHDLNLAAAWADRLVLLDNGAVAAAGPAATVLDPALLGRVYGLPMRRIDDGAAPGKPLVFPVM
jgi:ABC-type cobalamin/Fe3+-siderophores transport system ATPase subunit